MKLLLNFSLQEVADDTEHPHWRLMDPKGAVTCWGHLGNGSFESMAAILKLAQLGARKATPEEMLEAGFKPARPKLWTPADGGDNIATPYPPDDPRWKPPAMRQEATTHGD